MPTPNIHAAPILILDDEELNIDHLKLLLKRAGFGNVHGVTDSRRALPAYRDLRPDLVLLDLNMPHIDGFGVLEQLRAIEEESYVPVMVLTAQSDRDSRLRALDAGARDFLSKPFDAIEAVTRIRNLLEVRVLHRQVLSHNRALEEAVQARTAELRTSQLEVVQRLCRAAEYRDNETGLHILRMSHYSALLAREYGMTADECEMILNASPMHDVGKIGIPDQILLKPGKLDAEEWRVMQTHTTIGAELLAQHNSAVVELGRTIALTHHEKWDGSGYPQGLSGENIPLAGRVVAVCDVFDALTSERPYKRAWSVEEAVAEITRCSGTHFDPRLVTLFNRILPGMLAIRERYRDGS
jgi:putative two-component system response regulator